MEFCQREGSKATTVSEVVGKKDEAAYQAIGEGDPESQHGMQLREFYHIQKWAILERDFSISGGELGRCFLYTIAGCAGGQRPWQSLEVPTRKQPWQTKGPLMALR